VHLELNDNANSHKSSFMLLKSMSEALAQASKILQMLVERFVASLRTSFELSELRRVVRVRCANQFWLSPITSITCDSLSLWDHLLQPSFSKDFDVRLSCRKWSVHPNNVACEQRNPNLIVESSLVELVTVGSWILREFGVLRLKDPAVGSINAHQERWSNVALPGVRPNNLCDNRSI
jgi:hypothetical protein